jgi:predicted lipoprotein with Yx(FWY)xxD motif
MTTLRKATGWRLTLGTIGLAAVLAAGCGSSSKTASTAGDGGTTTTSASPTTTSAPTSSTTGSTAASTVNVASDAKLGQVLVGPNGHTLYLFEKDTGTTSACTGACADNWPALTAGSPTAGTGVTAGMLSVANGQVVYNGHLLYFFAADQAPGDARGVGIPSWFPVNPAGNKIATG